MEPRKLLYVQDDKRPLDELEQTITEEFTKLSQEIKNKGFVISENSDEKAKVEKQAFDDILGAIFEAQLKTEITRSSVTPFRSVEEIENYFRTLHTKIPAAPAQPSAAGTLYSKFLGGGDPKYALFSEYLTACEQLIKLSFAIKKINIVTTNPQAIATKLNITDDRAKVLLTGNAEKGLPPNPENELIAATTLWEQKAKIRDSLSVLPRKIDTTVDNLKKDMVVYKAKTDNDIELFVAALKKEEAKLQDEREELIARFNSLNGQVESLANKIQLLVSIKNKLNTPVSSATLAKDFSETAVKDLLADYENYQKELANIRLALQNNRTASQCAASKKETMLQEFAAEVDKQKGKFQQVYQGLIDDLFKEKKFLISEHAAFIEQAKNILASLEQPKQRLDTVLKEYPEINDILACLESLAQIKVPSQQISASIQKLNEACRLQATNYIVFTTDERKKWQDIGSCVAASLARVDLTLSSYITTTKALKNLQHLVKCFEKLAELKNQEPKDTVEINRLSEDLNKITHLRDKLLLRSRQYQTTHNILEECLRILDKKHKALQELSTYISSCAEEKLKIFAELQDKAQESADAVLHRNFIKKIVIETTKLDALERKLTGLNQNVKRLPDTARKAIKVVTVLENEKAQFDRASSFYHVTLATIVDELESYTKISFKFSSDAKLNKLLLDARNAVGIAVEFYTKNNISEANKSLDKAHHHISEIKSHVADLQEKACKNQIKTNLTLLEAANADLKSVEDNLFHGFASQRLSIEEFTATCKSKLNDSSVDLHTLSTESTQKLAAARELQRQAKEHKTADQVELDNSDIQMERSSEASQSKVVKSGNFFKRNWKTLVAGAVIGLVGTAALTGLVLSGVVSFGIIPTIILAASSPFIGAATLTAGAKIINYFRSDDTKPTTQVSLSSKQTEPVVVSSQASVLSGMQNSSNQLPIQPAITSPVTDPLKSLTSSGVIQSGVDLTAVAATTFARRASLRSLNGSSLALSSSGRRSLRQM